MAITNNDSNILPLFNKLYSTLRMGLMTEDIVYIMDARRAGDRRVKFNRVFVHCAAYLIVNCPKYS